MTACAGCDTPKHGADSQDLIVFNDNGSWCWFQDDRAIVDTATGKLIIGSVANAQGAGGSDRDGDIEVVSYDIATGSIARSLLHDNLQADDHNAPALAILPDRRVIAIYTRHHSDNLTRWRVSTPSGDLISWEKERVFDNQAPVTYSNILKTQSSNGGTDRWFNFLRSAELDPNFLFSDDYGSVWHYGGRLLSGPGKRPYLKYAGDGMKAIHFIASDQHPRDYPNNIYHGFIKEGRLLASNGLVVDESIYDQKSAAPQDLTAVYRSNGMDRAWPIDIEVDHGGLPYIVFSVRQEYSGREPLYRYYYGRFDGSAWHVYPAAFAGDALYAAENDYTGLAALHPHDPSVIFISTNVHPETGAPLSDNTGIRPRYEIFRGETKDEGKSWSWEALTANSPVDNIRPIVPRWDKSHTAVLWLRGTYTSYQSYSMAVVGRISDSADHSS